MKTRFLSILLSLCMLLTFLSATAAATNVLYSGTCGESATWKITDDGVLTISGTGTVTDLLPYEGRNEQNKLVHTIVIEEGITAIEHHAFCRYAELEYVEEILYLPDSLESIGDSAFAGNTHLKEIHFGSGLKWIGSNAFMEDSGLESIVLPESLEELGRGVFTGCSALKTAAVPGGIRWLRHSCFAYCTALESVYLGDGIDTIWNNAFIHCTSLKEIRFPSTLWKLRDGAFSGCTGLETLTLPYVERVSNNCFKNCTGLKTVTLGAGTESIGKDAFSGCKSLETIYIPTSVYAIEGGAFSGCASLRDAYFVGTEDALDALRVAPDANDPLLEAHIQLIPAMPDPVFGFFDMPVQDNWAYPGIAFCLENGLMNGMGGGYFQPAGTTTRAQLVTILWRVLGEPEASAPAPFTDLTQDWYREAVAWAAENNITNGTSTTTFSPDAPVTREQMVTIFYRMCRDYLELDVSSAAALDSFPDSASVSPWAQDAMQWAVAVKLISGVGDGSGHASLQPQGSATRAQIATVMRNFVTAFHTD